MRAGRLGMIRTPRQRNQPEPGVPWCADNGCYSAGYPGDQPWLEWLANQDPAGCLFAVAPDVVGDAAATWERSAPFLPILRELGYPAGLVAQDGLTNPEWDTLDALFIGGSTGWKLGPHAAALVTDAKARGKHVHFGRVNSEKRWKYAASLGADTADGTLLAYGPDTNLRRALAMDRLNGQPGLWGH